MRLSRTGIMTPGIRSSFWETVMDASPVNDPQYACTEQSRHCTDSSLVVGSSTSENTASAVHSVVNEVDFDTAQVLTSLKLKFKPADTKVYAVAHDAAEIASPLSSRSGAEYRSQITAILTSPRVQHQFGSVRPVGPSASKRQRMDESFQVLEPPSRARIHACDDCGSTFARGSHLRLHIGTVHEMKKPFRCDEPSCDATFGHVSSKYRHYRTVHLKRRDFQCGQCGLSFGEKSGLRKHELSVHIGSRPHQCVLCGFRFSFRLHLQQHIATVHEKRRPFRCSVCGHTFGQRSSLNRHMRQICNNPLRELDHVVL